MTLIRPVLPPLLDEETSNSPDQERILKGACTWSPLFISRFEDIMLAAANAVKPLHEISSRGPVATELTVSGHVHESLLWQGFCRVPARRCNSL